MSLLSQRLSLRVLYKHQVLWLPDKKKHSEFEATSPLSFPPVVPEKTPLHVHLVKGDAWPFVLGQLRRFFDRLSFHYGVTEKVYTEAVFTLSQAFVMGDEHEASSRMELDRSVKDRLALQ